MKTPVLESLFNTVTGLRPATLLKTRLWHRCFAVSFAKFLRTTFYIEHLVTTSYFIQFPKQFLHSDYIFVYFHFHLFIWPTTDFKQWLKISFRASAHWQGTNVLRIFYYKIQKEKEEKHLRGIGEIAKKKKGWKKMESKERDSLKLYENLKLGYDFYWSNLKVIQI